MNNVSLPRTRTPFRCDSQKIRVSESSRDGLSLKSHAHAKIVNLVYDPLFEDRLGNSPHKAARQSVTWEEPRSLLPPENSIPRVFARPCISQRQKGEAPSSINGLKRPEVSLETL